MITKIELGNFNRNASSPILLKEKVESDGSLSIRIYQRKDIDSIDSFKDKIKTMVKYGIEDFCMAHETFRPLLGTVGIKRIDHLQTGDLQSAQDLLQSIRSEARIGKVTEKNEKALKKILENHGLSEEYAINFYEGQYKNADFFSDLKKFIISNNNISKIDSFRLRHLETDFNSKDILSQSALENYKKSIKNIKNNLDNHFKKEISLLASQPSTITSSSETNFSGGSPIYLKTLQQEIYRKLDETFEEISQRSNNPKDEDIKKYLLSTLQTKLDESESSETWIDELKEAAKTRKSIDILFSTSWWITEERKLESLKNIQNYFNDDRQWLPEPVRNRIYPNQESTNPLSVSNPYVNINQ